MVCRISSSNSSSRNSRRRVEIEVVALVVQNSSSRKDNEVNFQQNAGLLLLLKKVGNARLGESD